MIIPSVRCTLHRARMTHVVNNLCAFLMFEVIETAWNSLQGSTERRLILYYIAPDTRILYILYLIAPDTRILYILLY